MDSLTQIVLGGAVAAAIAPPAHRRAALLAGAALGTLPDLDTLPIALLTSDPIARMVLHRGLSHSLLVLPWVAAAIWWGFWRFGRGRVAQAPKRWFWAIQLALITHPLLDAFTVYGTQLWWPLSVPPTMWASVFIIDPAYTIWLLVACVLAWYLQDRPWAGRALVLALALSTAYLGASLFAKNAIERQAQHSLAAMGLADAPRFSVPMPFTTLLWRVVALTPDGYVLGDRSLLTDHQPMQFVHFHSDTHALAQAKELPAVQQLAWFNRGFMRAKVVDGELVISDLRMGLEPNYNFNFIVARQSEQGLWQAIPPQQPMTAYRSPVEGKDFGHALARLWWRITHSDDQLFAL